MCVLVYARTHTQTAWVLDVSPGVGWTPGEPEESRSTKVQYTCRPYRCTQYICERPICMSCMRVCVCSEPRSDVHSVIKVPDIDVHS